MTLLDSMMGAQDEPDEELNLIEALDYPWPNGPYIPHEPSVPQDAFLWLQVLEALYGGAAGGGKSDALLMAALQYVEYPGYSALLLRKTYTELSLDGAIMDRSHKWLDHTDAGWNGEHNRWTFPSGARLQFGYLQYGRDRERYQSAEFQFIGMDELTQFEETDYRYMFSRLRRVSPCPKCSEKHQLGEGPEPHPVWMMDELVCDICHSLAPLASLIPLRMRGATNPGNKGHKWVKDRFIIPWRDGKYNPKRAFIPARLSDNPHVDQESYREALSELESELVEQLLEGDWDVREPGDWMMRDHRWIDAAVELGARMWDAHKRGIERLPTPVTISTMGHIPGLTNCTDWGEYTQSYIIWGLPHGGIFVPPSEVVMQHRDPVESTKAILEVAMRFEHPLVQSNYDAAGIQSMRTYLGIVRKLARYRSLRSTAVPFGEYKRETIGYLRTLARRTFMGETERILAIHPANEELIRQLKWWRRKGPETDDAVKEDDHGPDSLIAGVAPTAREWREFIEEELREAYQDTDNEYEDGEGEEYERS